MPSLRDKFRHYYQPSAEEFKQLWAECVFSLDANTMLNVYRYDEGARTEFLGVLYELRKRVWITHQAMDEFYRNRRAEIDAQVKRFDQVAAAVRSSLDELQRLRDRRRTLIDVVDVASQIEPAIEAAVTRLDLRRAEHPNYHRDDPLLARLEEIVGDRVGERYAEEALKKIHAVGEARYKQKIPPGYEDAKKAASGRDQFGDLVLWRELIDHAGAKKCAIVFITDDSKEDWWEIVRGERIGPRPELREEMQREAGVDFYMYDSESFLTHAREAGYQVAESTIREAAEVRREQSRPLSLIGLSADELERARPMEYVEAALAMFRENAPEIADSVRVEPYGTRVVLPATGGAWVVWGFRGVRGTTRDTIQVLIARERDEPENPRWKVLVRMTDWAALSNTELVKIVEVAPEASPATLPLVFAACLRVGLAPGDWQQRPW